MDAVSGAYWAMSRRDRWLQDFRCPECGREGTAQMSDDALPPIQSDYHAKADYLPDGFATVKRESKVGSIDIVCVRCGVSAL